MTTLHTYEKSALVTKLLEIRHNKSDGKLVEKDIERTVNETLDVSSTPEHYADALAYTRDAFLTFNYLKV